jgi:hypothetical protein
MTPKRVDENQPAVVEAARKAGLGVALTHTVGHGFTDLVVGAPGLTLVGHFRTSEVIRRLQDVEGLRILLGASVPVEVKNPDAGGTLNEAQKKWHRRWPGSKAVVESAEDLLRLFGLL